MMKANLKLERIGGEYGGIDPVLIRICKQMRQSMPLAPRFDPLQGITKHRDWVAKITGFNKKHGFAREFVRPKIDYAKSNSVGSRGVYANYVLDDGCIYEVSAPQSWKRTEKYFCSVYDGEIVRITREEVDMWLSAHSELTS